MAITKLNYVPGESETITDETLSPAAPVIDTWYHFEIGDWSHVMSDIVLKQSATPIPTNAYELAIDTKYTAREAAETGDTLYAMFKITNGTYAGILTTISGENFGTYVDNESIESRFNNLAADDISYDNTVSGLTAEELQAAVDELAALAPLNPSLGSEVTALSTTSTVTATFSFKIEDPDDSITNGQNAIVKFSALGTAPGTRAWHLISSSSGAEAGSTSWPKIIDMGTFSAAKDVYLILPIGWYRLYQSVPSGGVTSGTQTVKYKIIDTKQSYI